MILLQYSFKVKLDTKDTNYLQQFQIIHNNYYALLGLKSHIARAAVLDDVMVAKPISW